MKDKSYKNLTKQDKNKYTINKIADKDSNKSIIIVSVITIFLIVLLVSIYYMIITIIRLEDAVDDMQQEIAYTQNELEDTQDEMSAKEKYYQYYINHLIELNNDINHDLYNLKIEMREG